MACQPLPEIFFAAPGLESRYPDPGPDGQKPKQMERKPEPFQCRMESPLTAAPGQAAPGWKIHEPGSAARDGDAEMEMEIKICEILDDAEAFSCPKA